MVPQAGIEPAMFTTRVADFKSAASQPSFATAAFLIAINIILYFRKLVNILVAAIGFEPMIYCV